MGMQYSPRKQRHLKKAAEIIEKNAISRSGAVVIRKIGEEKVEPPPPSKRKINKQRRRLS